jgi:hypothetical protein
MAEKIILQGSEALVTGGDGADVKSDLGNFVQAVGHATVQGLDREAIPEHVRWKVTCGAVTVCIVELAPQLRTLQWITASSPAAYGPQATYEPHCLALPYVILKVPFVRDRFNGRAELFYRTSPVRTLDDELLWSNLLNVSPHAHGCTAWLCTQYLGYEKVAPGVTPGLDAIIHHLFGGGFNKSSEHHEGASAFSKGQKDGLDARVSNVERWEAESKKNPYFVLDVPWKPVGLTLGQLIHKELTLNNCLRNLGSVPELANLVLSRNGKKGAA